MDDLVKRLRNAAKIHEAHICEVYEAAKIERDAAARIEELAEERDEYKRGMTGWKERAEQAESLLQEAQEQIKLLKTQASQCDLPESVTGQCPSCKAPLDFIPTRQIWEAQERERRLRELAQPFADWYVALCSRLSGSNEPGHEMPIVASAFSVDAPTIGMEKLRLLAKALAPDVTEPECTCTGDTDHIVDGEFRQYDANCPKHGGEAS